MDEDGDTIEAVDEEEADAEDDAIKPLWMRRALGLPGLETHRGRWHTPVLPIPVVPG